MTESDSRLTQDSGQQPRLAGKPGQQPRPAGTVGQQPRPTGTVGQQSRPARKPPSRVHRLTRTGWLSNQHGAWAMMFVPLLVGSILGGFSALQAVLTLSWLSAFFFFNVLGLWIKAGGKRKKNTSPPNAARAAAIQEATKRRRRKYRGPMITYAAIAGTGAAFLVVTRPELLWWAPAFAIFFAVALGEMWFGRDRSFLARASAIIASGLLTPIAFSLGSNPTDWTRVWITTLIVILYFIGTIPYVKTLIRERGDQAWIHFSLGFHAALLLSSALLAILGMLTWWVAALWFVLLVRAWAFPSWSKRRGQPLRPIVIGMSEFGFSLLVILTVLVPASLT